MHGGDRYRNRVTADLSVNLNPLGVPECLKEGIKKGESEALFYPDPLQERAREAAAELYGRYTDISPQWIIPGNGASELITAVFHGLRPRSILIPAPCFTGYLRAGKYGCRIDLFPFREENGFIPEEGLGLAVKPDTDLIILTNPVNPSGVMYDPALLKDLLILARERRIPVLLDECFISFTGREAESGLYLLKEYPQLMVLRAFTKIFSLPGLRLGLLFSSDAVIREKLKAALPEWNLSSFSEQVLIMAGEHREELYTFIEKTAVETAGLRERFTAGLRNAGIRVYPSAANFILTRGMGSMREPLLKKGILTRSCDDMPPLNEDFIRMAVRPDKEQELLLDMLIISRDRIT